jgi:predicted MFS family arabinose efflux permease
VISGSTLLSESVPAAVRPSVQGAADFVMNVAGALGGAASGVLLAAVGYGGLNAVSAALAVPVVLLALRSRAAADNVAV